MPAQPVVVFDHASFTWPDGRQVLAPTDVAFSARTGLIGRNGVGKSTLLRLISGELRPTTGSIRVLGEVGVLPQDLTLRDHLTVADLLGVATKLAALRAIDAGDFSPALYEVIGDDWDVESRAGAELAAAGLASVELDRSVGQLSGGEAAVAAILGLRLARHPVTLLDEPTNNLDAESKATLLALVADWPGALVVVSHDLDLLNIVDEIAELDSGVLSGFGGGYDAFVEYQESEQRAAEQAVTSARQRLRVEQRQRIEAETRLARSARRGRKDVANSKFIGAAADERRRRAQNTAGKVRGKLGDQVLKAEAQLDQATSRLRRDKHIEIDLPDPELSSRRQLARLSGPGFSCLIAGPQRVALIGRNGVGKTRLIETLFGVQGDGVQAVALTDRIGYLPQRLNGLADALSCGGTVPGELRGGTVPGELRAGTVPRLDPDAAVLSSVQGCAPGVAVEQIRARLASFGLGPDVIHRPIATLSGGERFRVALAQILLADPSPQLVVLDEPTNNLDQASIEELVAALNSFRGGLLVVSHDRRFLARIGIHTWLELVADEHRGDVLKRVEPEWLLS